MFCSWRITSLQNPDQQLLLRAQDLFATIKLHFPDAIFIYDFHKHLQIISLGGKDEHVLITNAFEIYGQSPLQLISTHSQNLFAFLEVNIWVMVLVEYRQTIVSAWQISEIQAQSI